MTLRGVYKFQISLNSEDHVTLSPQESLEQESARGFEFWLRFWRWVIVAEQVLGGLFGLYVIASEWTVSTNRILSLLAVVFFLLSVVGGILIALDKAFGVVVSLVVQAIQLVQISTPALLFFVACGARLLLGFYQADSGTLGFGAGLSSGFFLLLNPPPVEGPQTDETVITTGGSSAAITGINLVALLAIICLLYIRASYRKRADRLET